MGLLRDIFDGATGGAGTLASSIVETASKYFPPSMTDKEKGEAALALQKLGYEHEAQQSAAIEEGEKTLNERIAQYEGTAADLKTIPILGPIMIFARGSQRVVWGFAVLWFDYYWLFGGMDLDDRQEMALQIINILVLGFLFGERAIQNVMPMFTEMVKARKGTA